MTIKKKKCKNCDYFEMDTSESMYGENGSPICTLNDGEVSTDENNTCDKFHNQKWELEFQLNKSKKQVSIYKSAHRQHMEANTRVTNENAGLKIQLNQAKQEVERLKNTESNPSKLQLAIRETKEYTEVCYECGEDCKMRLVNGYTQDYVEAFTLRRIIKDNTQLKAANARHRGALEEIRDYLNSELLARATTKKEVMQSSSELAYIDCMGKAMHKAWDIAKQALNPQEKEG